VAVVMFVKRQKNLKKSENIENIVREE